MKHPNPNMLLRIAQGDAFCAATEYLEFPRDQAVKDEALRFRKFGQNPKHLDLKPGWYKNFKPNLEVSELRVIHTPTKLAWETHTKFAKGYFEGGMAWPVSTS